MASMSMALGSYVILERKDLMLPPPWRAACLSTPSHMCGCAGEKMGHSDWTGVGVSSLSKNPSVVSLLVSSRVELDRGQRVWQGAEI